jgi:hypothetical protein
MRVTFRLQLPDAFDHINDTGNGSENSGNYHDKPQREKSQLQHHPRDRAHLTNRRHFARPARFHLHLVADEIMQDRRAYQNDRITRDNENRKPGREPSVFGIYFAPVADTKSNDSAQEQTFVRNRIEDGTEGAALFVATRNISVETVARGGEQENDDGGEALPFQRYPALDALTIIDRQRHEYRNHQNPDNRDLVRGSHSGKSSASLSRANNFYFVRGAGTHQSSRGQRQRGSH